jgi:transcriptional regulator with XRE-family HTH domain
MFLHYVYNEYRIVKKVSLVFFHLGGSEIVGNHSGMKFLKKLREDRGLSQYEAANLLGLVLQSYINSERSAGAIRLSNLVRVREVYKLSWSELGRMIEEEVSGGEDRETRTVTVNRRKK